MTRSPKFCALLLFSTLSFAQVHDPIAWSVATAPRNEVKTGSRFNIIVAGRPDPGWHLYAMQEPEGGPIATQIGVAEGDPVTLLGVSASRPVVARDPSTSLNTGIYTSIAQFTLRLQAAAHPSQRPIHVLARYQSCNDRECLPPRTVNLEIPITIVP